jgi:hypothetical protein
MGHHPNGQAARFESEQAAAGIADADIHMSRLTGMAPADIEHLRIFTLNEQLLIIIRCPRRPARYWHGKVQPKTMVTKQKSGEDGLVDLGNGRKMVSDYDLMSVYRLVGPGQFDKVFFSGIDRENKRSRLTPQATAIIRKVNTGLLSRFQHGAQDDYEGADHPNVKLAAPGKTGDRFVAFNVGAVDYLARTQEARDFYLRNALVWPYDSKGHFVPTA